MPAASTQLDSFFNPDALDAEGGTQRRASWFSRFLHAVQEARIKQAEREVARFIEGRGGRITDTLERQIERRFV